MDSAVDTGAVELAVKELLGALRVTCDGHLTDTPVRCARAWTELLAGYTENPADHLDTTFAAPADPGLVIQSGIALQSVCAHHLLPFTGVATVAYRPSPGQRIVGLSKLARVITGYARRLQVQEQIGFDTVAALSARLQPSGALVVITAAHDCMRLRGVRAQGSLTTTVAHAGLLLDHERAMVMQAHMCHVQA